MELTLSWDAASVRRLLQELPKTALPLLTARALNKTAASAQSAAVKTLAQDIGLNQRAVRSAFWLRKASARCLTAVMGTVKGKRLPLIQIDPKAKQGAAGVCYRGRGGVQRLIPHAFLATMPTGHRGIYARKSGAGRLPIHELQGPSVAYVFQQSRVQETIHQTVALRWPVVCEQELRFELKRRRLI